MSNYRRLIKLGNSIAITVPKEILEDEEIEIEERAEYRAIWKNEKEYKVEFKKI